MYTACRNVSRLRIQYISVDFESLFATLLYLVKVFSPYFPFIRSQVVEYRHRDCFAFAVVRHVRWLLPDDDDSSECEL